MHPKPQSSLLALTALLLATVLPLSAAADGTPGAQPWLDKMMALYENGPFTFGYTLDLDLGQMGQPIRGTLEGRVTYGDRSHLRQEMTMSLSGLPGSDGETPAEMDLLSVSDGEQIWTEIEMMGTRQVMKISRADADKLAASQLGALGANPSAMDPVAQLETMTRTMDFELLEVTGGRVSLRATASAESLAELGQLGALGVDRFLLVLDETTGFPVEMRAGDPGSGDPGSDRPPVLHMRFHDLKLVDRGDLPEKVFEYSPPEGVPVTDLGTMVGAGSE